MPGKFWTQVEAQQLRNLISQGLDYESIAHEMGRTRSAVNQKAVSLGIRRPVLTNPVPTGPRPKDLTEEALQSELALAKRENRRLREALGSQLLLVEAVQSACREITPPKLQPAILMTSRKPGISAVQIISDWHVGEVISLEQTDGFGEYNFDITNQRIEKLYAKIVQMHRTLKSAYRFDEIVMPVLGDMVQGEVHPDYAITNEFDPPTQAAKAGYLLGEFANRLSVLAPVRVEAIMADNHGRLDLKPICKRKGLRNWNVIIYTLAQKALEANHRVRFNIHSSPKSTMMIRDYRFFLEHGDGYMSHVGYPWYAVGRGKGREAERRMLRPDTGIHYYIMGHWHSPGWVLQNVLVNGSLSGTSEYDHLAGRYAEPCQVEFFVGKHGVFGFTPWDLS